MKFSLFCLIVTIYGFIYTFVFWQISDCSVNLAQFNISTAYFCEAASVLFDKSLILSGLFSTLPVKPAELQVAKINYEKLNSSTT